MLTAKETQYFTITVISWLTLFKEIIIVYSEIHTKETTKNTGLLIVKVGVIYNVPLVFKGVIIGFP